MFDGIFVFRDSRKCLQSQHKRFSFILFRFGDKKIKKKKKEIPLNISKVFMDVNLLFVPGKRNIIQTVEGV